MELRLHNRNVNVRAAGVSVRRVVSVFAIAALLFITCLLPVAASSTEEAQRVETTDNAQVETSSQTPEDDGNDLEAADASVSEEPDFTVTTEPILDPEKEILTMLEDRHITSMQRPEITAYYAFSVTILDEATRQPVAAGEGRQNVAVPVANGGITANSEDQEWRLYEYNKEENKLGTNRTNQVSLTRDVQYPTTVTQVRFRTFQNSDNGEASYILVSTGVKKKSVAFQKLTDAEVPVAGVMVEIYRNDGSNVPVGSFVSELEACQVTLAPGSYIMHEVYSPEGYYTAPDVIFQINHDGSFGGFDPEICQARMEDTMSETGLKNKIPTLYVLNAVPAPTSGDDQASVTVTKTWPQGDSSHPEEVTAELYRGAERLDAKRLSQDNNWTYTWDYLPSNPELSYSVRLADDLPRYATRLTTDRQTQAVAESTAWLPLAENLDKEGEFLITAVMGGRECMLAAVNNGDNLQWLPLPVDLSLEDPDPLGVWQVRMDSAGFHFYNSVTGRMLQDSSEADDWTQTSVSTTTERYSGESRYQMSFQDGHLMLRGRFLGVNDSSGRLYTFSTKEEAGTPFVLYKDTVTEYHYIDQFTFAFASVPIESVDEADSRYIHENRVVDLSGSEDDPNTTVDDVKGEAEGLYRLYLDVQGRTRGTDLLLIVDRSSDMKTAVAGGQSRSELLREMLTSSFLRTFLTAHPDNRVAISWYGGWIDGLDSSVVAKSYTESGAEGDPRTVRALTAGKVVGWTDGRDLKLSDATDMAPNPDDGTAGAMGALSSAGRDYTAGLYYGLSLLEERANSGNDKVVIFFTSGPPTFYTGYGDRGWDAPTASYDMYKSNPDSLWRVGLGTSGGSNQLNLIAQRTEAGVLSFQDALASTPGLEDTELFSVALHGELTPLTNLLSPGSGNVTIPAQDVGGLENVIRAALTTRNVIITENLSRYVRYYDDHPDLRLTRTDSSGHVTLLWDDSGATSENVRPDGGLVAVEVAYIPGDGSYYPAGSTGRVRAAFDPAYSLEPGAVYTLSFNVRATASANTAVSDLSATTAESETTDISTQGGAGPPPTGDGNAGDAGFPVHDGAGASLTYGLSYTASRELYAGLTIPGSRPSSDYTIPASGGPGTPRLIAAGSFVFLLAGWLTLRSKCSLRPQSERRSW